MTYWINRVENLKQWMNKNEDKTKERLGKYYESEYAKLDKEIASYYAKYGKDNVIEYNSLMQKLSYEDRNLLITRMDEFALKYPQYSHLLPVRESVYKLNRLEGLQYSIVMQQHEIAMMNNEQVTAYLNELAVRGSNIAMETLGFGKNFYSIDSDVVKLFVGTAWCNGENFSTRIWNDTNKLANYLTQDIAQGFARGDSYDKLTKSLRKRFLHVSKNDAYRLIFTEGTYVMAESSMQPFTEDFTKYRISTAGDSRVCPICKAMAEKVFDISERQAGVNFPPFHPWCRCTFEIVVDDWDKWLDEYVERHGINSEGKGKRIKRRMGYKSKLDRPIIDQEEIISRSKQYAKELDNNPNLLEYDNGYPISNFLNKKLGYDSKPIVVSSDRFQELSKGKTVLYRGVTDYDDISSDEMVKQFKYGNFYCGRGVYGNGTYVDLNKNVANYYAYDSGETNNGSVMEMILSDDAKTIDYREIFLEYEKIDGSKKIWDKKEGYQKIIGDVGSYAAIKGYDAILLNGFQNKYHVIILNRGKVIVKE